MLLEDFSKFPTTLIENRSYEKHQQKLARIKMDLEKKKQVKTDLLDEDLIARSNRLINNRLKSHEFKENGINKHNTLLLFRKDI